MARSPSAPYDPQAGASSEARLKGFDSHAVRALLTSRAMLVKIKRDLENQIRGLLKIDGLLVGTVRGDAFCRRVLELANECPELGVSVIPLLTAREAIDTQLFELDRRVSRLARADRQTRSFMTVPGVGPVTAPCFQHTPAILAVVVMTMVVMMVVVMFALRVGHYRAPSASVRRKL